MTRTVVELFRRARRSRIAVVAVTSSLVALLAAATATAYAGTAASVLNAAYNSRTGQLRMLTSSTPRLHRGERRVSWNQMGIQGPAGAQGAKGDTGAAEPDTTGWVKLEGTGTLQNTNSAPDEVTTLSVDPQVILIHRQATGTWSGFIAGPSTSDSHIMQNKTIGENTWRGDLVLTNVTIAGRTGGLVLVNTAHSEGFDTVYPGTHQINTYEVVRASGDFRGAVGHGLALGSGYKPPTGPQVRTMLYWIRLYLPPAGS